LVLFRVGHEAWAMLVYQFRKDGAYGRSAPVNALSAARGLA
jgi:hypothetical protein